MAINTGPSYGSARGNAMQRRGTMAGKVGAQRPAMGGGGKSVNMGGPMGPSGAPNVGAPIFGASVMPGMEGTSDTPQMVPGGGGMPMVPGGGFTGGRFGAGNINSVGSGAAPNQPPVPGPMAGDMRKRMPAGGIKMPFGSGGIGYNGGAGMGNLGGSKAMSFGYNPIPTGPSYY